MCLLLHGEGLKHALLVGVYLSLITFPSILTAPTIPMSSANEAPDVQDPIPNSMLISHIINQARIARQHADKFVKEEYVVKKFGRSFEDFSNNLSIKEYEWLPQLDKALHEDVPEDHLKTLKFTETLKRVYTWLQRVDVGINRSIEDEKKVDGKFVANFTEMKSFLDLVRYEVQMALTENNLTPDNDITEAIMGNEHSKDNTSISVRNFVIYRNYLNLLDYIVQVFTYFNATMPTA